MPYNKTAVKDKLGSILLQIYTLGDTGEIQINHYADFTEALENLWKESLRFYQKDKGGSYKILDEENYRTLIAAYGQALEKSLQVQSIPDVNPSLFNITENIKDILYADMAALENVVPGKNLTLPQVVEKGRSATVYLGNVELNGAGNAMSSRIPIEFTDGWKKREGFFTEKYHVPGRKEANDALKSVEQKYPEFKKLFDALNAADDKTFFRWEWSEPASFDSYVKNEMKFKPDENPNRILLGMMFDPLELSEEDTEAIAKEPSFMQCLSDIITAVGPVTLAYTTYCNKREWLGGEPGERIDNRNSAMSMVAKLIGMPDLIAQAEPMTIIANEQEIEGTFMANAYGKEVFGLQPDDPIHGYTTENYDNPVALTQIADMQVLDFICGNVDRHEGNFFMQFEGEGKDAKLSKLTLIDNDLSFGKTKVGSHIGNKYVNPEEMGLIDRDTATKVMGLTHATLYVALKPYGLSDEQLQYAWERAELLQNQITASLEAYKDVPEGQIKNGIPRIVAREDMAKYSLATLAKRADHSQFEVFANMSQKIKAHEENKAITQQTREKFNEEHGIQLPPPKKKAVRLPGVLVMDEIFHDPEEEPAAFSMEYTDIEIPREAQIGALGGAMSSRKMISYVDKEGVEQKGFFTSRMDLDVKTARDLAFKEWTYHYPQYKDFLKQYREYVDEEHSPGAFFSIGIPGYSQSDLQVLREDPVFSAMLSSLSVRLGSISSLHTAYSMRGASMKSTVEMRNVAASNVAALLGNEKLLAKATPMRLKQGDLILEGAFMEFAEGVDLRHINKDDPVLSYNEEVFNHGPGLKALSDLQVLDYICMNLDRHDQNLFYQFKEVDGQPRFVGVQGIDNDYSFVGRHLSADDRIGYGSSLNKITVISKEQADAVNNLKPEDLENSLAASGLDAKEIIMAVERAEQVKQHIAEGKIRVLSDEDWEKETLASLSDGDNNIFERTKNAFTPQALQEMVEVNERQRERNKINFTVGQETEFDDEFIEQQKELAEEYIKEQKELAEKALNTDEEIPGVRKPTEADRILSERSKVAEAVKAEHQENLAALNTFSGDNIKRIKDEFARVAGVYKKADHFFGGSKEFTDAANEFRDLKKLFDTAEKRLSTKNHVEKIQFMDELNEQIQYAQLAAAGLERKTAAAAGSNQRDRHDFANEMLNFTRNLADQVKAYDRALLESQNRITDERNKIKASPIKAYINANLNQIYRKGNEDEYLDFVLKRSLSQLKFDIEKGNTPGIETAQDLAASYILKEALNECNDVTKEQCRGNVDLMFDKMRENDYIKRFAEGITKDPEGFAEVVGSGKLGEIYENFKKKNVSLNKLVSSKINEVKENKQVIESKDKDNILLL